VGNQYRPGIYYTDIAERDVIFHSLWNLQKLFDNEPVMVENLPLSNYYEAEEHHQKYLEKNPGGYCHIPADKYKEA
jgi:peptide methionine sulfoxide reductase MsrA